MPSCFAQRCLMFAIGLGLLAAAHTADDCEQNTRTSFGENTVVKCTAPTMSGVQYLTISWFKVGEEPEKASRLLARRTQGGPARTYSQREVQFANNSRDIFLPNVTCLDAGVYECRLAAPAGHRRQKGMVHLTVTGCQGNAADNEDIYMVITATLMLVVALVIFGISYCCLKNMLRERSRKPRKEILLDAPLKPLEKKDLMLIYTLGPNWATPGSLRHVCV